MPTFAKQTLLAAINDSKASKAYTTESVPCYRQLTQYAKKQTYFFSRRR